MTIIGLLLTSVPLPAQTLTAWNCCRKTSGSNRAICTPLNDLRTRVLTAEPANTLLFNSAIDILCNSTLTDANLQIILTEVATYAIPDQVLFLKDMNGSSNLPNVMGNYTINNARSISNFANALTLVMIRAWKTCRDLVPGSRLRLDWDVLTAVATHNNNPTLVNQLTITGENRFLTSLKTYAGNCNTCDPPPNVAIHNRLVFKHIYLNMLARFTTIYAARPGFASFITGEATATGINKPEGAYHLMLDLTSTGYTVANVLNFEDIISNKMTGLTPICACKYDVELTGNRLVDYKSLADDSPLSNTNQFKQYLQYWSNNTSSPRSFEFVFNSSKVTLAQAKQKFIDLLQSDPEIYFDVNAVFFSRFPLDPNATTPVPVNRATVRSFLSTIATTHPIFNFVTVKP